MTRLALLFTLALAACQPGASQPGTPTPAEQLVARSPDALVVDVRTPAEYASGHVAGARNVDVTADGFAQAFADVPREQAVYVYCRSGRRSGRAKSILEEMGFQTVVNAGGFDGIAAAGAETE